MDFNSLMCLINTGTSEYQSPLYTLILGLLRELQDKEQMLYHEATDAGNTTGHNTSHDDVTIYLPHDNDHHFHDDVIKDSKELHHEICTFSHPTEHHTKRCTECDDSYKIQPSSCYRPC